MEYHHVDVFTDRPYSGNGLTVFFSSGQPEKTWMQTITREMRQFESIFLYRLDDHTFRAFIFTMEEELDFAGHPVIGAAAVIHDIYSTNAADAWSIELNAKTVHVDTVRNDGYYSARMNQGKAEFGKVLTENEERAFLGYLNLSAADKFYALPLQVVSTGLPYLLVPVKSSALPKVKVAVANLSEKLSEIDAMFFYVLDVENLEGRTWDNLGQVEDVATGSAAGPVGAYLVSNALANQGRQIILKQGSYLARPAHIKIEVSNHTNEVFVEGNVFKIATGHLISTPT